MILVDTERVCVTVAIPTSVGRVKDRLRFRPEIRLSAATHRGNYGKSRLRPWLRQVLESPRDRAPDASGGGARFRDGLFLRNDRADARLGDRADRHRARD